MQRNKMLMQRKRPPPFTSSLTHDGNLSAMGQNQNQDTGFSGGNSKRPKVAEPGNQASNYDNHGQKFTRKKPKVQDEEDEGGFGFGGSGQQQQFGNYAQGYEEDDGELR